MRRFRIATILGIPIQLDLTFLLVLPLFAYLIGSRAGQTAEFLNGAVGAGISVGAVSSGATPWLLGAVVAVGLFAGVVLHELAHAAVALRFGYAIDSITLWILGGIAAMAETPDRWEQELLIAAAGPIASALVGVGCYLGLVALPGTFDGSRFVLGYLAVLNAGLAAFNALPGFPMDGGRVLRALLARTRSQRRATRIAASVGKGVAVLLAFVGIVAFNVLLIAVAFFIYVGASGEVQRQLVTDAFEGVTVGDLMTPRSELDTVDPETTVTELFELMLRSRHVGYPVVRGGDAVGIVTLEDAGAVAPVERDVVTVGEVMQTDIVTVDAAAEAADALAALRRNGIGRVLVTDEGGEFAGLLTRTDLMRALAVGGPGGPADDRDGSAGRRARSPAGPRK